MEILPIELKRKGSIYKQIIRDEKRAIYSQEIINVGIIGYEVFEIRVMSSFTFPGTNIVNPEKEKFPSDEDFGKIAWTYDKLETAKKKYDDLGNTINLPKKRGRKKKLLK